MAALLFKGCVRLAEVVLFLDMLTMSMNVLISPIMLEKRIAEIHGRPNWTSSSESCGDYTGNSTQNSTSDDSDSFADMVASQSADWSWYITAASLAPAIPLALVMGTWSDEAGRRPVMILGTVGVTIGSLLSWAFIQFELPLYSQILGGLLQSLLGGHTAVISTTFAYIIDDSSVEHRTMRLTIAEALMWVTIGVGQLLAGNMMERISIASAALFVAGLQAAQLFYVLFLLKESLPRAGSEKRTDKGLKEAVFDLFHRFKDVFFAPNEYRARLWVLMAAFALVMTVLLGSSTVDILYYMGEPFCISEEMAGYIGVTRSEAWALFGLIIAPVLVKFVKVGDHTIAQTGVIFFLLSRLLMVFSYTELMLFAVAILSMPGVVIAPTFRSIISKQVDPALQGTLFSVVSALETLASLAGSVAYGNLFAYLVEHSSPKIYDKMPSAAYAYVAMVAVCLPPSLMLLGVQMCKKRRKGYHLISNYEQSTLQ